MNCNPYEAPKSPGLAIASKSSTHGRAVVVALVQQAFVLLLAALMLDGGRLLRAFAGALIFSWVISLMVMLRHRDRPSMLDLAVVKYGFWFAIVLLLLLGRVMGLRIFGV